MAANSAVSGLIWPKSELVQDIINVLVTCKFKKKDEIIATEKPEDHWSCKRSTDILT